MINANISTLPLTDKELIRTVRITTLLALVMPPFTGSTLMGIADFYPMPEVFQIFGSYTGPYVLIWAIGAAWFAKWFSAHLLHLGTLAPNDLAIQGGRLLKRLPWLCFGVILVYSIFGALSADFAIERMGYRSYDLRGHLYNQFGLIPVVLITVLPIFFYFTDQLGRYFGPRGLEEIIMPIGVKLAVLGILTPLLIDSFLIGYYANRTGLFGMQTLMIWLGLLALAAGGTWLAWRSVRQGVFPLQEVLRRQSSLVDKATLQRLQPLSLDEFGALTRHIAQQLETQRKLVAELSEAKTLFQTVIESANALVVLLDAEGRIVLFNKACETLTGLDRSEVLGRFPWETVIPEPERDEVRRSALDALANHPQRLQGRYTNHLKTKGGELRLIDWSNAVLLGSDGKLQHMVSFGLDVTESRSISDALRRSEETYARAEEITHIGSWDWDITNGSLRWSDEIYRIFGQTPRSFGATYEAFLGYVHPEDRKTVIDAVNAAVADPKQTYSVQHRLLRPGGEIRLVHERGTVYRDLVGKPLRMIGTVHDVTEQQAMEARLRAALQEKELLLKEIYHRVKNNLQVVSSLLVLQGTSCSDQALRAMLEESASRVKSMALVHEQLYQSGDLVRIEFVSYARQLMTHLSEHHGHRKGISLRMQIDDVRVGIETAVPLGLIINELVSNAYKHAFVDRDEGEILVRLSRVGEAQLELDVSDSGRGWPPESHSSSTRSLGMRLLHALSEQLGGSTRFENGVNGGARFVLLFAPELPEEERLAASLRIGIS